MDSADVVGIHVEPNDFAVRRMSGSFDSPKQFFADAASARRRHHFYGLDVAFSPAPLAGPFDNGKTRHLIVLLSDPCGSVGALNQLEHELDIEPEGWLETDLFDGVKSSEVLRQIRTVEHIAGRWSIQ
jgi:hypothetical protein